MDLQFKSVPFEVKASSEDGSEGTGLGSVFFNIDSYNEIVDNGAFDDHLPQFLSEGFIGGLNHNWDDPIGRPTKARSVKDGLEVSWKISPTAHGKDVMVLLKDKVVKKLSIGYRTLGRTMLETLEDVQSYWKSKGYTPNAEDVSRAQGGAVLLTKIHLYEVSPVTVPANSLAVITAVKAAREAAEAAYRAEMQTPEPEEVTERLSLIRAIVKLSDAEDILRDAGLSRTERTAFISSVKTLLRDAASDDAGTPDSTDDGATEEAPAPDETPETEQPENQPNPTDEPDTPASETPASEDVPSGEGQAIVSRGAFVDPLTAFGPELLAKQREVDALLYLEWEDMTARFNRRGLSAQ